MRRRCWDFICITSNFFYPDARSSGATLKIFAHIKKYASPPRVRALDNQDENKIILPIILPR
jgi:hypothetical protein